MNRKLIFPIALLSVTAFADGAFSAEKGKVDGKKGFEKHCASCHANGGNIINPAKTLKKASMEAGGIKSAKDIVAKIRKPGPGMTAYDKKAIPDKEAQAIAEYIRKTFK